MTKFILKISIAVFTLIFFALPAFAQPILATGPIVTCGRGTSFCNLCDIPVLIKNLIDYMTFYVALPLAAVMFVVGGYFYLIAGGSPQKVSQAKEVFFTTIKGLAIVLLSWLFIAELMVLLAGGTTTSAQFRGLTGSWSRPWNQLQSPASCPFGTPTLVNLPPPSNCGNGICDIGESVTCPGDCSGFCGDGFCDISSETPTNCPTDCGGFGCEGTSCVAGGTGASCNPFDPSACGGGSQQYGCVTNPNTNVASCVFGASGPSCDPLVGCNQPPPPGFGCDLDPFSGAMVCVQGGGGAACNTNADCQPPPPTFGCNLSNQCVIGGTGGSCNPANGNADCQPVCNPNLFCPPPPFTHHYCQPGEAGCTPGDNCTTCGELVPNGTISACWELNWCSNRWVCASYIDPSCVYYQGVCCERGTYPP